LGLIVLAQPARAQDTKEAEDETGFSFSLEGVSDYRFRGLSLSDRKPALQAGAEYAHQSGFFVGAWGSTIARYGGARQELDLYAGYAGSAKGLDYRASVTRYLYPGGHGVNYVELNSEIEGAAGPALVALEVDYAPPQKNSAGTNLYTGLRVSHEWTRPKITAFVRGGRENGWYRNKWDWEVGVSHDRGPLTLKASLLGARAHSADLAGDEADPALVVGAALAW
jgi:uncharacterized protein (TIGR02001 family)